MHQKKFFLRLVALVFAITGFATLAFVVVPIVAYEATSPDTASYISPVPETEIDLTKASNWFVGGAKKEEFSFSGVSYYTISIPVLGIDKATVAIGGEDLADSLIQYPGTALPGKAGNTTIFGHSVLPQFYNPKNYMSIFSKLPTLRKGDQIFINYDGVDYRFVVENKFEVYPTDIQVLEQDSSDSFLTLVTCVPPGHPLKPKRLIVRARIINL